MNKSIKTLSIYKYCTLGGVERCLLDRAMLYKRLPITCYICFMNASENMLAIFQNYILSHHLETKLKIITYKQIQEHQFDFISAIDTPEVLNQFESIHVECHTGYLKNRLYLNDLPDSIDKIIVPSKPFANIILNEHSLDRKKVCVLPNFVTKQSASKPIQKKWNKKIIFYFGRLDTLKNYHELLDIFEVVNRLDNNFLFYILSPSLIELNQIATSYKSLREKMVLMPGLKFSETTNFLQLMKLHQGIYVSSSLTESFGLATAEVLAQEIPVVLTDIPTHRYLVENKKEYLYQIGNIEQAAEKIIYLAEHYEKMLPDNKFLTEVLPLEHLSCLESILNNKVFKLKHEVI